MRLICSPSHPLAAQKRVSWAQLQTQRWVMPPPWATSRTKLHQLFYKNRLNPPTDCLESASYLATLAFVQTQNAVGFVARNVAQHLHTQGLVQVLPVALPMELPPVGVMLLAGQSPSVVTLKLLACLREVAQGWEK